MKLIVISYPDRFSNEATVINGLFESGLEYFHLRKPEWDVSDIEELIQRINPNYYERIVLHDQFNLAEKYNLGGIHFTHRTKELFNKWLSYKGTKSTSCHELHELQSLPLGMDYAFFFFFFP